MNDALQLLVVEDNDDHFELIADSLAQAKLSTLHWQRAHSVAEAQQRTQTHPFHLVLLDLSLPDSDTQNTLGLVSSNFFMLPVIVLTSFDDPATILQMIQQGASDCIPKVSLSPMLLERAVRYAVDRHRINAEFVRKERELQREYTFRELFELSNVPTVVLDRHQRIQRANLAFRNWLHLDTHTTLNRPFSDFLRNPQRWLSAITPVLNRKAQSLKREEPFFAPQPNTPIWGEIIARPIDLPDSKDGCILTISDVTERHLFAEKLAAEHAVSESANRLKSTLISMLGHDIRNPLGRILTMAALLRDADDPQAFPDCVESIHASAQSLLQLLDNILDFARLENGQLRVQAQPANPQRLVAEVIEASQFEINLKALNVAAHFDLKQPSHSFDPRLVRQVLANIFANAIKFTPKGGAIHIRVADSADSLLFEVKDSGIGIRPEDQAKLFQPFNQADPSIAHNFGGTGLGLSLCRQLCAAMHGTINLDSTFGHGTTLRFAIPLQSA